MKVVIDWNLKKPIDSVKGVKLSDIAFTKPTILITDPMNPKTSYGFDSFISFEKRVTWRTVLKAYHKNKNPGVKGGDDHHYLEYIAPFTKKEYPKKTEFYTQRGAFYKAIKLLSKYYDIYYASTGS